MSDAASVRVEALPTGRPAVDDRRTSQAVQDQANPPPQPRRSANGIGYAAPVFYPRFLRQLADALDALVAFESEDPSNEEAPHFVGSHHMAWPIYDPEIGDEDPELVGWLAQYDAACWVFVPYVAEVEAVDG